MKINTAMSAARAIQGLFLTVAVLTGTILLALVVSHAVMNAFAKAAALFPH